MRTGSAAVSEIPGQLYMMVVDNNGSKTGVRRAKSNASRQGIIVNTMNGAERHLHISGTTFRVSVERASGPRLCGGVWHPTDSEIVVRSHVDTGWVYSLSQHGTTI